MVDNTKPQFIFVLGGPGAGKGTQCEKMIEKFRFNHLSTGDLLRAELQSGSQEAQKINEIMKEGKLVPSAMLVDLIKKAVIAKGNKGVFLLDGFPRNQENLDVWNEKMKDSVDLKFLLVFECGLECLEKRLMGRAATSGRSDDNPETIKKRFNTFLEQTKPIVENYKGNKEIIVAEKGVNEIFDDVTAVLKKYSLINNTNL